MDQELPIEVQRDGQSLGRFSLAIAIASMRAGILKPNDWAWHEGLPDWVPLESLLLGGETDRALPKKEILYVTKSKGVNYKLAFLVGIVVLLACVVLIAKLTGHQNQTTTPLETATPATAEFVDPFGSNAVVYSWVPSGHLLGDKLTVAVCSTNYIEAYSLMREENEANYKVGVSLAQQLFNQENTPDSEYKEAFKKYVLDKSDQQKILFVPSNFKMQIIKKMYQGDPSCWSIYECRAMNPGSEGMIIYIQEEYLTTHGK